MRAWSARGGAANAVGQPRGALSWARAHLHEERHLPASDRVQLGVGVVGEAEELVDAAKEEAAGALEAAKAQEAEAREEAAAREARAEGERAARAAAEQEAVAAERRGSPSGAGADAAERAGAGCASCSGPCRRRRRRLSRPAAAPASVCIGADAAGGVPWVALGWPRTYLAA